MPEPEDKQIIQSWHTNADAWISAVQNQEIESRKIVTNEAIIDAVMEQKPSTALDVGCGEGWLSRELYDRNVSVSGIDAVPELIESTRKSCVGNFHVCSYERLAEEEIFDYKFDAVICNFSLLGKEDVELLIDRIPSLLRNKGVFYIQTLHPSICCEAAECKDGWREGSWEGFGPQFKDPAPWYYRKIASWEKLLTESGFSNIECREPKYPESEEVASMILVCKGTV